MSKVFIFDIDGTLADNSEREHLLPDRDLFNSQCGVDAPIHITFLALSDCVEAGSDVYFLTSRMDNNNHRSDTVDWLHRHSNISKEFIDSHLIMRPDRDFRKSYDYKITDAKKLAERLSISSSEITVYDDNASDCEAYRNADFNVVHVDEAFKQQALIL